MGKVCAIIHYLYEYVVRQKITEGARRVRRGVGLGAGGKAAKRQGGKAASGFSRSCGRVFQSCSQTGNTDSFIQNVLPEMSHARNTFPARGPPTSFEESRRRGVVGCGPVGLFEQAWMWRPKFELAEFQKNSSCILQIDHANSQNAAYI